MKSSDDDGESTVEVNPETPIDKGSEDRETDQRSVAQKTPPRLFGQKKAAAYMGVSYDVLLGYRHRGELASIKLGRRVLIDKRDLDALIERYRHIEV